MAHGAVLTAWRSSSISVDGGGIDDDPTDPGDRAPGGSTFHGTHVSIGVIFLLIIARKAWRGDFDNARRGFFTSRKSNYEAVEIMGLYWHFVDLVWVFIFAFFYLW